jgi:hypothetical protein
MPSIPEELTYQPNSTSVENVVLSRQEVYLQSPEPSFSPNGANRISFQINTRNFIDLGSVEMYAVITTHVVGDDNPSQTTTGAGATKLHVNSTMSLFSDITISTGSGVIIEQISNASEVGQMLSLSGLSDSWCETVGSFSNAQCSAQQRDSCIGGVTPYRLLALKMSGFLTGSHKYIRPSSMGGLHISCTLASNAALMRVRDVADNGSLSLTQMRLFYDELSMAPSYVRFYEDQYENRGLQIVFPSYGCQVGQITSNAPETVPFSASAMRCQALMSAVRVKADGNNKTANSLAFVRPGAAGQDWSYTYEIAGARLPPSGVTSYARAFHEISKIAGSRHDSSQSLVRFSDFSTNDTPDPANPGGYTGGKFIAAVDCEQLESSSQTGIRLSPGSNNLLLHYPDVDNVPHDVFVVWMYDRALSIVQGQASVTY